MIFFCKNLNFLNCLCFLIYIYVYVCIYVIYISHFNHVYNSNTVLFLYEYNYSLQKIQTHNIYNHNKRQLQNFIINDIMSLDI